LIRIGARLFSKGKDNREKGKEGEILMMELIEMRIIEAVRGLLVGRVNELLREVEFSIPALEFGACGCGYAVEPVIVLSECERTEKERIIRLDTFALTVTFSLPDATESERFLYAYAGAVCRAVYDDPTLGGITDRAVIVNKKYIAPKKAHCGEGWALVISMRLSVEGIKG
jgi:hypothetical protein